MLRSEVLPAPFGPITDRIRPRGMSMVTSSTATTPPKRLEAPSMDICTAEPVIWPAGWVRFMPWPRTLCRRGRETTSTMPAGPVGPYGVAPPQGTTSTIAGAVTLAVDGRQTDGRPMLVQGFAQCHALKAGVPRPAVPGPAVRPERIGIKLSPDALCSVDDQFQLGPLLILGQGIAPRHAGKA